MAVEQERMCGKRHAPHRCRRRGAVVAVGLLVATSAASLLSAQQSAVARERTEYARWLASAPTSPLAAVALLPIGAGIRLGPSDADVRIAGAPEARVQERGGRVTLTSGGETRPVSRGRPVSLGRAVTLLAGGAPGRTVLTVFAVPPRSGKPPVWYEYDSTADHTVTLDPPDRAGIVRVLAADGTEVEAAEAGTVTVVVRGQRARLTVRRMPGAAPEESDLEVYFRDQTNGRGTYPAGRFVALVPAGAGRYRLDFNRARNPFCAYSSIYPCPAPWRGNSVAAPVEAGERYAGGGLDPGQTSEQ